MKEIEIKIGSLAKLMLRSRDDQRSGRAEGATLGEAGRALEGALADSGRTSKMLKVVSALGSAAGMLVEAAARMAYHSMLGREPYARKLEHFYSAMVEMAASEEPQKEPEEQFEQLQRVYEAVAEAWETQWDAALEKRDKELGVEAAEKQLGASRRASRRAIGVAAAVAAAEVVAGAVAAAEEAPTTTPSCASGAGSMATSGGCAPTRRGRPPR